MKQHLKIVSADSGAALLNERFEPLQVVAACAVLVEPPYAKVTSCLAEPIFTEVEDGHRLVVHELELCMTLLKTVKADVVHVDMSLGGLSLEELSALSLSQLHVSGKARGHLLRILPQLRKIALDIKRVYNIDVSAIGKESVPVRIAGSTVVMPNPMKLPVLMENFMTWLHGKNSGHPATIAADAHFKFVSIHPFTDGNGRTARLLMNLLLMQEGYSPALIRKEDRLAYINAIEKGQLHGEMNDYYQIIYRSIERSLDIYLKAVEKEKPQGKSQKFRGLLKIGELAKAVGESVPTIRYWTQEKLLEVAEYTNGGYQLYGQSMIVLAKKIRQLQQKKRLTISEIKESLKNA